MTNTEIDNASKIMLGSTEVQAMYVGDVLLWQKQSIQLPYDAEIEYLESTGYPYIDTGIYNDSNTIIDMKMSAVGKDRLNGSEYNSGYRYKWGANGTGYIYYGFGGNNHASNTLFSLDNPCIFYLKQGQQYVKDYNDNTILSSSDSFSTFSRQTIRLFRCMSGGNFVNVNGTGSIRIYYCNITNSTINLQLIPVRIGTVGYLYDKVSGQLFGNSGTGDFILGPDKT